MEARDFALVYADDAYVDQITTGQLEFPDYLAILFMRWRADVDSEPIQWPVGVQERWCA